MSAVIDDHLLFECLAGREPLAVRRARGHGRLYTSGLWYHRLCRALALSAGGALSSRLARLPEGAALRVIGTCRELPEDIGLVSLRDLAWPMATLVGRERLNLIALEALVAAQALRATVCVWEGDQGPRLRAAADALGVPVVAVPL